MPDTEGSATQLRMEFSTIRRETMQEGFQGRLKTRPLVYPEDEVPAAPQDLVLPDSDLDSFSRWWYWLLKAGFLAPMKIH